MSFVTAAMRNRTFLCVVLIVTALVVILVDAQGEHFDLWDICEVSMLLLGMAYLHVVEPDEEFRVLMRGMLFGLVGMTVIAHIFG